MQRTHEVLQSARPASAPTRPAPILPPHAESVLGLQRTAGNAAVAALLQREAPAAAPVAPTTGLPARTEVESIKTRLKGRETGLASFLQAAKRDVENVRGYFKWVDGVYARCYGHHTLVVKQAGAEAETEQAWLDFVVGVGIGFGVGVMFEAAIAGKAAEQSLEELAELGAEIVEGGIGSRAKIEVPKPSLEANLSPAVKRVEALQRLDDLNAAVLDMAVPGTHLYGDPIAQSERMSGELRVIEAGGQRAVTDDEVRQVFLKLTRFDQASQKLEAKLKAAAAKFDALRAAYTGKQAPSDRTCEQDIWIPWITAQSPEEPRSVFARHVLERPVIANHFVDIGLAARGSRGGRLNADITTASTGLVKDKDGTPKHWLSPWIQLMQGAREKAPEVQAYWRGVFLAG